jgi:hypothetical protein
MTSTTAAPATALGTTVASITVMTKPSITNQGSSHLGTELSTRQQYTRGAWPSRRAQFPRTFEP